MAPQIANGLNGINGHETTDGSHSHPHSDTASSSRNTALEGIITPATYTGSEPSAVSALIPAIISATYNQDQIGMHNGFEYTCSQPENPNHAVLERMLVALEDNSARALTFASSTATASVLHALGTNAHVLGANTLYGRTFRYMSEFASQLRGLEVSFFDFGKASDAEVIGAVRENTKLVWIEAPTNPTLRLPDIPHITALIRRSFPPATRPLILIDATFLSPFYISPLAAPIHADVVLHSFTQYINGHSDVLMGAAIFPAASHVDALYQKLTLLRNEQGAVPGAFDAWLSMHGAKTLAVRMREHGRNAVKLAQVLRRSRHIKEVIYPGLQEHPGHEVARELLSVHAQKFVDEWDRDPENGNGDFPFGGMVGFRIAGDEAAAERFLMRTRLFTLAGSLGGVESHAELPEKITHRDIPPAERADLGISADLVRLSVGIEDGDDLVADVEQALEWAVEGWRYAE